MKKLITGVVAVAMATSMSTFALATGAGSETVTSVPKDVVGAEPSVGTVVQTDIVYKIDVQWGAMVFDYSGNGTWNPDTHTYDGTPTWTPQNAGVSNKIDVTNHSNIDVKADFDFDNVGEQYKEVDATFSLNQITLDTAEGTTPINAPTNSSLVSLTGTAYSQTKTADKIGTITVAVDKNI